MFMRGVEGEMYGISFDTTERHDIREADDLLHVPSFRLIIPRWRVLAFCRGQRERQIE